MTNGEFGGFHSCTILNDDDIKCWGSNDHGQLVDGSTTDRLICTLIHVGDGRNVTHLPFGVYHSCAVLNGVDIKYWGRNEHGQLRDGTRTRRLIPTPTNVGEGRTVI